MFRLFKYRDNDSAGKGEWMLYPTDSTWPDKDVIDYLKEEGELRFGDHHLYHGREVVRVRNEQKVARAKVDYRNLMVKEIETLCVRIRNLS